MLRRSFSISAQVFKIKVPQGASGDLAQFRSAFVTKGSSPEKSHEKPSASPNRFRTFHERNTHHNKKPRPFNSHGDRGNVKSHTFKGGHNHGARRNEPPRPVFDISTGTERAQMALKNLIMKVKAKSANYEVNYVDPESKKFSTVGLHSLVNELDLSKQGIRVLPPQGEGHPIIRIVPVSDMLQEYVDELAAIKQQELLDMGSARALKAASMRAQAERKKSATKILTLSWSISVSDLLNQKRNEIENRLKKDGKLVIFVGEKSSLSGARMNAEKEDVLEKHLKTSNVNWERMDEDENLLEMKKREMIFGKLEELLQELDCKIDISGSLDARMMIKITSNNKKAGESESNKTELSPKEMKRLRKLERAKEGAKEKEHKLADEDIDSLYQLKIED